MLRLPPVRNAERYVGLYVYDFGAYTSIGYTAAEIRILRESEAHRGGTAYEVYRVTDAGVFELRGVLDERLAVREAICFLRSVATAARRDYDTLCNAAQDSPAPCSVEIQLAEVHDFRPPHVTAMLYPAAASAVLSGWLSRCEFDGGDRVIAGIDAHDAFMTADALRIESCQLAALLDYTDRLAEEVLRTIDRPVQR